MRIKPLLLFLFLILTPAVPGRAQKALLDSLLNHKRVYETVNIGDADVPKINGDLDDEVWGLGDWHGDFTQQQPYGGAKASEDTYIKLLYDRSNLYVAIVCRDSEPDRIRSVFTSRDQFGGDMAGIAIDSYHDKRTAFEFNLSAAGQKVDLKHLGDYQWDVNWNAVWDGAVLKNDTAWIAEMQIPFSQIRYSGDEEHVWGMHIWRWTSRKYEEDQWQYIPKEAPAMVYLFGELKGIGNIRKSRQIELLPYGLSSAFRKAGGTAFEPVDFNGGVDAKVGISSDYTLDLTINPDFGQVEADPSVLNLTAFEVFYEEKRPFFLEGNEIFDFKIDGDIPYYSRRIGAAPSFPTSYRSLSVSEIPNRTTILGAAKFTGKSRKGLSLGVINGLTSGEHARATDETGASHDITVEPMSNYLAGRIKKEYREGQTSIGGMFSQVSRIMNDSVSPSQLPSGAVSGGLDLLHYWDNRNYFIEAKAIASRIRGSSEAILSKQLAHNHRFQRPDADYLEVDSSREELSGHGGIIRAGKGGGNWNFSLTGQYRSPGLNLNDMGYIRQSDFFGQTARVSYEMNTPKASIRNYSVELTQEAVWTFGGENTKNWFELVFEMMFSNLWSLHFDIDNGLPHLDTRELRGGPALRIDNELSGGVYLASNGTRDLAGAVGYFFGKYNYENSGSHHGRFSLTWRPLDRLRLFAHLGFDQRTYHQQYINTLAGQSGSEYLVGRIDQHTASLIFRSEFFITPEMSIQYYGSPYYSVGKFDVFNRVDQSASSDPGMRLEKLDVSYDPAAGEYSYDRNSETFRFSNPDFTFMQFRSNLVFRWEYKLGSTLYAVWSHDRSDWSSLFNPVRDITGDLFRISGNNVFMIKLNFWFSV